MLIRNTRILSLEKISSKSDIPPFSKDPYGYDVNRFKT